MPKPWLQQPDESDKAFRAFEAYLEERDRTQLEAYREYVEWRDGGADTGDKPADANERTSVPGYFSRWASDHDWSRRRKAYYREIDERAYDELMESKARRKVERVELLDDVLEALEDEGLRLMRDRLQDGEASVQDVTIMIDKIFRHYRDELDDLPTQEHDVGGANEIAAMLGVSLGDDGDG